jgi:hypothetical protein
MAMKPTVDDARLILELYDLRREPEMRKARQWWLTEFWPNTSDEYLKVAMAMGSNENNWLRKVISYWGIAASFVENGVLNERLFFTTAFCGELFYFRKGSAYFERAQGKIEESRDALGGGKIDHEVEARTGAIREGRAESSGDVA